MTQTTLARAIQVARSRKGWSLKKLAKESGVSVSTIHRIENAAPFTPRGDILVRLADALEIDVDELLDIAEAKSA